MKKTKIGIVGHGFVGRAVVYGFKNRNSDIKIFDKFQKTDSLEDTLAHAEFIFVCLPTPYKGKRIDLSIMNEMVGKIAKQIKGSNKIIIIKSTIIPGTTERYAKKYPKVNFCFNPEFLREKTANQDFVKADRTVIGVSKANIGKRVRALYEKRFSKSTFFITSFTEAELAKYMNNLYLATKVIFANEMFDLAERLGINYNRAKEIVGADKRIGPSHLDVTSERGFGGKCFPKDLVALIGLYKDLGLKSELLESVQKKNLRIRKYHDWEDIPFVKS